MEDYFSKDKGFIKEPESYWIASTDNTDYPALEEDITVDVVIVGGGITGITTGYLLKKEGLTVAIIDADRIASGTTGHTTAKITSQHDLIYHKMINQIGMEKAKQYAQSNEEAIKLIAQIIEDKNIDCDFAWQSAYAYTESDDYVEQIQKEVEAAQDLGIKASYVTDLPLPFPIKAAVQFDRQAQFHPRKYLLSLAEDIAKDGSYIFENTRAVGIEEGEKCSVVAENGKKIIASQVIIASHYPFSNIRGLYVARIYQERAYIIAIKAKSKFPDGMYINTGQPTRSLRSVPLADGQELILIVGENHKTGHGDDINEHYKNLIDFAHKNFDVEEILYRWSAQDCMTMDEVPFIGNMTANHPNIYVATGFKKWGMTSSAVSAMVLRDLIIKGDSPWKDVYDPSRFTNPSSIWKLIKENLDVAVNLISGKLSTGSFDTDVDKGQGKIINIDGQRVGAYRDDEGKLYLVNITCTHLGCELKWNSAERTWDCPCHGSRFSPNGDVIEGPAYGCLERIEVD